MAKSHMHINGLRLGGPHNIDRRLFEKLRKAFGLENWHIDIYRLPVNLVDDDGFIDYCERKKRAVIFLSKSASMKIAAHEFTHAWLGNTGIDEQIPDTVQEKICNLLPMVLKKAGIKL